MTSLDLSNTHPVLLAWLRRTMNKLPDPPRLSGTKAADVVPLERWTIVQDRWGLCRIDGIVATHDHYEFPFRVYPVAVDLAHLAIWTCHGWLHLGVPAQLEWDEPALQAVEKLELWCDALREELRDG